MFLKRVYIIFFVFFLEGETLLAQALNDSVFQKNIIESFQLKNAADEKNIKLQKLVSNSELSIFIFLSPECPLCQNYMPFLNALNTQYKQLANMIGIVPGKAYSSDVINAFRGKYKVSFPLLIDKEKKITDYLHASITPEVIVLNNEGQLVYKGAIDNRLNKLGEMRVRISENYLSDAITQYQKTKMVCVKRRKAIGCTINDF